MKTYRDSTGNILYQCPKCHTYFCTKKRANPKNHTCDPSVKFIEEVFNQVRIMI